MNVIDLILDKFQFGPFNINVLLDVAYPCFISMLLKY